MSEFICAQCGRTYDTDGEDRKTTDHNLRKGCCSMCLSALGESVASLLANLHEHHYIPLEDHTRRKARFDFLCRIEKEIYKRDNLDT